MPKSDILYLFFGSDSLSFWIKFFSFWHKYQFTCFSMFFKSSSVKLPSTTFRTNDQIIFRFWLIFWIFNFLFFDDWLFIMRVSISLFLFWFFYFFYSHYFFLFCFNYLLLFLWFFGNQDSLLSWLYRRLLGYYCFFLYYLWRIMNDKF